LDRFPNNFGLPAPCHKGPWEVHRMRRWNGWGEEGVVYPVPAAARAFLEAQFGPGTPPRDVDLGEAVAGIPASRLPEHPLVTTDPVERLRHCAGQSLGDWINLRGGTVPSFPDGVAYPLTEGDVRDILRYAEAVGAVVIPYGGGTSVVGHLSAPPGDRPVLTVDMRRMNGLVRLDRRDHLATFQAGVRGPELEAALRAEGFTLGHFPQSFEYSTLGGWVATRSVGQFSLGYGRIERLFVGGEVETPTGTLHLPVFPASGAGPDLREFILGSEGRMGIITLATVRVTPLPERESIHAAFFPGQEQGIAAVRDLARSSIPLVMLRLSLAEETTATLALAGHGRAVDLLDRYLALRGAGEGKSMLLYGACGSPKDVRRALGQATKIIKEHQGIPVGSMLGRIWYKNRFRAPYLRNTLWEMGYALDTLETATTWSRVSETIEAVERALRRGLEEIDERVYVFTHLSHVYPHGSSVYTTYLYRIAREPRETLRRWRVLKKAASEAIVRCGGTITHQHGVGLDHLPYLESEKSPRGIEMLRSVCRALDPRQMMNPGKLFR